LKASTGPDADATTAPSGRSGPSQSGEGDIALSVRSVSKVFSGTRALDHVDLTVHYGEIHALCGGNGSGKSTLIKILCGIYQADGGSVTIGGRSFEASAITPEASHSAGIRVVHQDPPVWGDLSVAENLVVGAEFPVSRTGRVRWREVKRRAREQIDRFDIAAKPESLLRDLPISTRTQVVIARALQDVSTDRAVVVLDEPTAALPVNEVRVLLSACRGLAAAGHAILFVSHRLDEVLTLTDRVTIFRDGKLFAEHRTSDLTEAELIESIIGRRVAEVRPNKTTPSSDRVLSVEGLSAGPLHDIDLEVKAGEVIGIAGLLGSGRTELLRAICGDLRTSAGTVKVNNRVARYKRLGQALNRGIVLISEDRATGGVFRDLTVDENLNISVLDRYRRVLGFRQRAMRRDAQRLRQEFRVKAPSGSVLMQALSGGNQQKVILARWLRRSPMLLLLDEPTQGVDVGARADIYAAVRARTASGAAAVVVTSDLEELAQVVDRAVVLRTGRIIAHVPSAELSAHRLNELIYSAPGKA